ncbi:MAG: metallophosphoesterase family protein [Chloroflexi bacterium]|nr:metallophosphoesterase family protein [Chloroflexota bacterium]
MRILIITDIHGNYVALDTVLEHAGDVDAVWCLGDVVGYGPNPNECVERVAGLPGLLCLLGNHDAAALDMLDLNTFNPEAKKSIEWTVEQLTPENRAFLQDRPQIIAIEDVNVTLAHGSPRQPVFEYLLDTRAASENFEYFETAYCFVGHTHLPVIFQMPAGAYMSGLAIPPINQVTRMEARAILNPGSVGQPRDRDPRAAYAIFDPEACTWDYRRVAYPVEETQRRMQAAGLPERHVLRLEAGW